MAKTGSDSCLFVYLIDKVDKILKTGPSGNRWSANLSFGTCDVTRGWAEFGFADKLVRHFNMDDTMIVSMEET